MTLKVAYFAPTVMAIDEVPAPLFSKIYSLVESLHQRPELNDAGDLTISVRGGQQIQVFPNRAEIDVSWLIEYLQTICQGYMDLVTGQSGADELNHCKPVVNSIWTIRQTEGDYQEMHSHAAGNLSGNLYIDVPEYAPGGFPSDGQVLFRLPQSKDITKFIMNDTWKYTPQQATVIMFPSHIPHTVYPWKGTGYRTILAFDAVLRPKDE